MSTKEVQAAAQHGAHIPIACTLTEEELSERREGVLADIIGGFEESNELPDGYEFRFSGSAEWAAKLAQLIPNERACCPFLTYELIFEPNQGPIWLRLKGPEGVKEFIRGMIEA